MLTPPQVYAPIFNACISSIFAEKRGRRGGLLPFLYTPTPPRFHPYLHVLET